MATTGQPDGKVLMDQPCKYVGPFKRQIILINQTSAASDDGVWIDASDLLYGTIEVTKVGTASAYSFQLYGSNAESMPTGFNSTDSTIGAAITATGFTSYTGPYRWINLRLNTGATGGGTVGANFQALTQ
jgi:hypothetical protein